MVSAGMHLLHIICTIVVCTYCICTIVVDSLVLTPTRSENVSMYYNNR